MHHSESIILAKKPFREADLIITFFSRADGLVRGVARGAKKSRKRFGGMIESGYLVDLHYQTPSESGLVPITEAALISPKRMHELPLEATSAIWLATEMAIKFLADHEKSEEKFRLLARFIEAVYDLKLKRAILIYFLFKWISLCGYLPESGLKECNLPGSRVKKATEDILKRIVSGDIDFDITDAVYEELLVFAFNYSKYILGKPLKMESYLSVLLDMK